MTKVAGENSAVLSMTGFGSGTVESNGRSYRVEVRTLNHRGLDVKVRSQDCSLSPEFESDLSRRIRACFIRGSVLVSVRNENKNRKQNGIDTETIKRVYEELLSVQASLGLKGAINLDTIGLFYQGPSVSTQDELGAAEWKVVLSALDVALMGVVAMREAEGAALAEDLRRRLFSLRALVARMRESAASVPERAYRRFEERVAALNTQQQPLDASRVAQEMAILAERLDVNEELVRLDTHIDQAEALLTGKRVEPQGRRLEFLAQEIGREINTVGSKIQDTETLLSVIEAKVELEKFKEQSQNIE